jgi:hypothetical protein
MSVRRRYDGFWGMNCWNGLSEAQQERLISRGTLPLLYEPEGSCPNPAEVEITTVWDRAHGPRFYCLRCAAQYMAEQWIARAVTAAAVAVEEPAR